MAIYHSITLRGTLCGKSWSWLGVAMGAGWHRCKIGTSEPVSARTNPVALGGLQPGTNELIGENLGIIIRLDANQ